MDVSAIFAMEDIIDNLKAQGCQTIMILHGKEMLGRLIKMGIGDLIGKENLFLNDDDALKKAKKLLKEIETNSDLE